LTDLYLYYFYTGDLAYLQRYWVQAKLGVAFALSLVDDTGLANLPPSNPGMLQSVLITDQKSEQNPYGTLRKGSAIPLVWSVPRNPADNGRLAQELHGGYVPPYHCWSRLTLTTLTGYNIEVVSSQQV